MVLHLLDLDEDFLELLGLLLNVRGQNRQQVKVVFVDFLKGLLKRRANNVHFEVSIDLNSCFDLKLLSFLKVFGGNRVLWLCGEHKLKLTAAL